MTYDAAALVTRFPWTGSSEAGQTRAPLSSKIVLMNLRGILTPPLAMVP